MVLPLLLALLQAPSVIPVDGQAASRDARPVRVWLGTTGPLIRGQSVQIFVQAAQDGDLIVLHRRTDGRIEVLFPSNPASDPFVRSGTYEIRGSGNRSAWVVSEPVGNGMVLAALSVDRLRFDEFVRLASWDSNALEPSWNDPSAEGALSDIVQRMLGDGSFNYDVVTYAVAPPIYAQQPEPPPTPDTLPSEAQQPQPDTMPNYGSYPVCLNCTFIGYEEVVIAPTHFGGRGGRHARQQDEGICGIRTPCTESQKTHALALPRLPAQSPVASGSGQIPYRSRVSAANSVASTAPRTPAASAPLTHVRYTSLSAPEPERRVVLVKASGSRMSTDQVERGGFERATSVGRGSLEGGDGGGSGVARRAASTARRERSEGGAATASRPRSTSAAVATRTATAGPVRGSGAPPVAFQGAQARVPANRATRRR